MAYINNVKRHSLHLQIDLPATAPEGHPHIIDDIENISEDDLPDNLEAVDVIATVLYKWNPEALHNLLDMSKNQFHFGYLDARRNEIYLYFYIARDGPEVRVGAIEKGEYPSTPYPNYEVQYCICSSGKWEMVGGRGRVQGVVESYKPKKNRKDFDRCLECEDKIEKSMIRQAMWERDSSASFWYEVNGMDMIGGEEEREGGDGSGDEVGGNPLLNNSFSLEAAGRADTESSKTTRKSRGY